MKNKKRGLDPAIIGLIVLAVIIGGIAGAYQMNVSRISTNVVKSDITFSISQNTLQVLKNDESLQKFDLDADAIAALKVAPDAKQFITDLDVNFDGYKDVGVFRSTGYAGVNNYYDFYIFNSKNSWFNKDSMLVGISNPVVDANKKQVISNYRSGSQWHKDVFQFDGKYFTKIGSSQSQTNSDSSLKTYTNSKYGFKVNFPTSWRMRVQDTNYVAFEDSKHPSKIDSDSPYNGVVIHTSPQNRENTDWQMGFGMTFGKTIYYADKNISITMMALTEADKIIEDKIAASLTFTK